MIAIINTTPEEATATYSLQINDRLITKFQHRRSDGLGVCLIKAGLSVLQNRTEERVRHWLDWHNIVRKLEDGGK